jgi:hypothetical protein
MTQYCPEWIFGICSAATAKEFLSSENSLNSISRKFSKGLSEKFNEIKFEEITACAEEILQFLSDLEANEEAVNYIDSYIYRRMCFKSSGAERKISGMFSSELDPVKTNDYSGKNVAKIFRATIFAIRNHTLEDMPPGWSYEDVEGLDWFKDLLNKPTDILDNF